MELRQVLESRRSLRDFSDRPVDGSATRSALEAAFMAPTYDHLRSWHFVFVDDPETRLRIVEAEGLRRRSGGEGLEAYDGLEPEARAMYRDAVPKQRGMLLEAPELAIVVFKPKRFARDATRVCDLNCLAAAWCCIENFLLALAEKGIYGVTCVLDNTEAVKAVLGIPSDLEIAAAIPYGYEKEGASRLPQKKLSLDDHVHRNSWQGKKEK